MLQVRSSVPASSVSPCCAVTPTARRADLPRAGPGGPPVAARWSGTAGPRDAGRVRAAQRPRGREAARRGVRAPARRRRAARAAGLPGRARSGPTRSSQASAQAMAARRIRYAEPPASWADRGPEGPHAHRGARAARVGTCLDTVVVLAAALEQAGIRPLLWVVEGHAFLGLLAGREAPASRRDHRRRVRWSTWSTSARSALVETTMLTEAAEAAVLRRVHRPPYDAWLTGDLDRGPRRRRTSGSRAATTSSRCLARRGTPTAASRSSATDPASTAAHRVRRSAPRSASGHAPTACPVPPRVQQWKNTLLDLACATG